MPYYCTVPRCTSMAGKAKNVSFHQFPRDEELARLWNDILKRGKPYTKYSKVCSLHFKPEDYTITSVGKNKGQWRTLRKDAVPSQNLPSETPAPYSRKQWESWSQNSCTPNVMDPTIHQQMAQAIYMQTMLAMQAAGATETPSALNGPSTPEVPLPHSSHHNNILKGKETTNDSTSYKCTECTKCFKDPDVFILHKRSHIKDIKTNGIEKENYNVNLTLRSNPILANLLKTNNEANFDPNMVAMENLLMTALAANMDYLRNFNMIKEERDDAFNDDNCLNHARSDSSAGDLNHVRSDSSRGDLNRDSDMGDSNRARSDSNSDLNRIRSDLINAGTELHCSGLGTTNNDIAPLNAKREHKTLSSALKNKYESQTSDEYHMKGIINENDMNHTKKDLNHSEHQKDDLCQMKNGLSHPKGELSNDQNHIGISYAMNFATKLETRNIDNDFSGNYYKERCFSPEYENDNSDNARNDFVDNVSVQSHCDNDLNESLDSNSLVIDESV